MSKLDLDAIEKRAKETSPRHERDLLALVARVRELEVERAKIRYQLGVELPAVAATATKWHSEGTAAIARAEQAESALREARAELEVLRRVGDEATLLREKSLAVLDKLDDWEIAELDHLYDECVQSGLALARWDEFKKGRGGK